MKNISTVARSRSILVTTPSVEKPPVMKDAQEIAAVCANLKKVNLGLPPLL